MSHDSLLVELGTEELPPKALKSLALAFRDGIVAGLKLNALEFGEVQWFATPRRLAVLIASAQLHAPDKELEVLGPPLERAKDENGQWTPAALGFARKQGVNADTLQIAQTPKGERLALRKKEAGVSLASCFIDIINQAIADLPIPKRMRWGANRSEFVRPVHWVVAMIGENIVEGEILGLPTGRHTRGHRFHSPGAIELKNPSHYCESLRAAWVIADFDERQALIRAQVEEQALALEASAVISEDLLEEVTGLVEWPVALAGSFEERFLEVPAEALVSAMKEHQKYFHIIDNSGHLLPAFITVANLESSDPLQIIKGNERVIRPRLSDAAFFFNTDKKTTLAERVEKLDSIIFQQKLGTLKEKTNRVQHLASQLAADIGADPELASRAAYLSKTDLISDLVGEFPDLQGVAGYYYALHDGENPQVAQAIREQYLPRFAGDKLPSGPVATCLALADRLDTLVGIFGIGQPPTGSRDPFALRRASLAVLRLIVENGLDLDLRETLAQAAGLYPKDLINVNTVDATLDYMLERFRAWFEDEGIPVQVFRAVSAKSLSAPLDIQQRVYAVHQFGQLSQALALAAANKRVSNILGKLDDQHNFGKVDPQLLEEEAERQLAQALIAKASETEALLEQGDYTAALCGLASLQAPVDQFFDDVMVMAEDQAIRNNRLNILKALRELFLRVADISQLAAAK